MVKPGIMIAFRPNAVPVMLVLVAATSFGLMKLAPESFLDLALMTHGTSMAELKQWSADCAAIHEGVNAGRITLAEAVAAECMAPQDLRARLAGR